MKKIHVQNKLTSLHVSFIAIIIVLLFSLLLYGSFSGCSIPASLYMLVIGLAIITYIWYLEIQKGKPYVSEIQLTDSELILIYKLDRKISKVTHIALNDIESVHAKVIADDFYLKHNGDLLRHNSYHLRLSSLYKSIICKTDISIKTTDNNIITFSEDSYDRPSLCSYSFMLRFLRIAKELPNFTFDVEGNSQLAKEDIQHFAKYGKQLNLFYRLNLQLRIPLPLILITLLIVTFSSLFITFYIFHK